MRGGRSRLVCWVVEHTAKGLVGHTESVGLNPLGIQEPTEVLKPGSSGWKANNCPIDCRSIKSSFPTASGCSLRNVLNIALQAATSSQPELAEDEAYLSFPKGDESVDEFKESRVLGPKTTFYSCLTSHKYKLPPLCKTWWRTGREDPVFLLWREGEAIRLKGNNSLVRRNIFLSAAMVVWLPRG